MTTHPMTTHSMTTHAKDTPMTTTPDTDTDTDTDFPCCADGRPLLVEVQVRHQGRWWITTGQTTRCPHLVVIAGMDEGRFTGGFVAAHLPTGRVLHIAELIHQAVPPYVISDAIEAVAHLDWSSPDDEVYRTTLLFQQAWTDALLAAATDSGWW